MAGQIEVDIAQFNRLLGVGRVDQGAEQDSYRIAGTRINDDARWIADLYMRGLALLPNRAASRFAHNHGKHRGLGRRNRLTTASVDGLPVEP
jgi:hypothetical protein